jgi:hypothetical protein
MRKIPLGIVVLMMSFLASCGGGGGGDTAESVSKEIVANIKEMAVILNEITDEASAKVAVPKIGALRAKMRDAGKRAKSVPKMDAATEKRIGEMMGKAMPEAIQAIGAAQQRLMARPDLLKIIEPAMQNMQDDL